jgi:hypothetical protein
MKTNRNVIGNREKNQILDNKMNKILIGEIISNRLKLEGRTKKWLANQVGCDPSCFCKTLKKNYLDTDLLLRISFALNHDFFSYLTTYYNENRKNK